ncbi:Rhamnogalacturonase B, N-terminal-domain-containing protein [Vararia minispora EC-137]|uniref:Rhamnogalacturonase B, N-terminal-domain-containing protein n=1 Tax=Vararia minispora EC-137 TaxID=1314806 RepID=A0ACB8QM07_9AGAM|nr:Rhamnogalacturonase B, N-terminal-domain-containing protein [Vararia minispora EC-137]
MFAKLARVFTALACVPFAFAAFGVTTPSSGRLQVDSGAGLVTLINTANGDIVSILFNGVQLQDQSKFTQLSSGLGSATVTSSVANNIATITITTSSITHYYIVRSGINTLYIGTFASAEPSVGELRLIARLNKATLPNGPTQSDVAGGTAIEGSDVFTVNGQTRSKFYSSVRFIEDQVHGVTGNGVAAWMIIPGTGYETSSGGPFFRDIDNQGTSQQEVYFYMNSNHEQTETYRTGFFGPYALAFTTGSQPSGNLDTSFMSSLGLQGYVPASGRGTVRGTYSGVLSGQPVTIGFKNSAAQYWATGSGGSFTSPLMKPGTYTATLFQGELEVGTGSVSVSAGGTASLTLASTLNQPTTIWAIGVPDGTPAGFLNADKIQTMHPSDTRMSSWGPITFTIGQSASSFPMAQFKDGNSPTTIHWTASSSQIGARTLRIRTSSAFAGGRPQVQVNSWTSAIPAAPTAVNSRGVTRGTWRGINTVYDYAIPAGTLVAGANTILINVVSGSSGTGFLSPNFVYDSVELF